MSFRTVNGDFNAVTFDPFEVPYATVGAWAYTTYNAFNYRIAYQSAAAQNNSITFAPRNFTGGTWGLALLHVKNPDCGIYTISISADGVTWTDLGTIDGYAASATPTRSTITGQSISSGEYYLRVKVATKNASSSGYNANLSQILLARTGA